MPRRRPLSRRSAEGEDGANRVMRRGVRRESLAADADEERTPDDTDASKGERRAP